MVARRAVLGIKVGTRHARLRCFVEVMPGQRASCLTRVGCRNRFTKHVRVGCGLEVRRLQHITNTRLTYVVAVVGAVTRDNARTRLTLQWVGLRTRYRDGVHVGRPGITQAQHRPHGRRHDEAVSERCEFG
jgi:hypothetical protein